MPERTPAEREQDNCWENERVVYRTQREHEIELNKATAAFEHAIVSPLFLLNGGAAVAFLTLLGTTSKADSSFKINLWFAVLAASLWASALIAAAVAVQAGYESQRHFTRAVRVRRELIEVTLDVGDTFRTSLSNRVGDPAAEVTNGLVCQAAWKRYIKLSQGGFVVGLAAAAASVLLDPVQGGVRFGPLDAKSWVPIIGLVALIGVLAVFFAVHLVKVVRAWWRTKPSRTSRRDAKVVRGYFDLMNRGGNFAICSTATEIALGFIAARDSETDDCQKRLIDLHEKLPRTVITLDERLYDSAATVVS
jgi:hypothetical protein